MEKRMDKKDWFNENLILVFPNPSHRELWRKIIGEFEERNEKIIPYGLKLDCVDYDDYLQFTIENHNDMNIPQNYVPSSTYFLMDKNQDKILGAVNIRHRLNESLLNIGGHVGYGLAPSERKKGYAPTMLALALDLCLSLGITRALVTCNESNTPSSRTIRKNGGVLESLFPDEDGTIVERYWIDLTDRAYTKR